MLDPQRAALVALAAAIGTRDAVRIREAAMHAAGDAAPGEVEELLLQSHLFVGFPDAMSAIAIWREVSGRPAPAASGEHADDWMHRGEAVCATVYGSNYRRLRANVAGLHPEMDRWMVEGGYGRVLGRPGLGLATRELCVAALLATWGALRQLHSHLRGALNAGARMAEVDAAVDAACELVPPERAQEIRALWNGIRTRAEAA